MQPKSEYTQIQAKIRYNEGLKILYGTIGARPDTGSMRQ